MRSRHAARSLTAGIFLLAAAVMLLAIIAKRSQYPDPSNQGSYLSKSAKMDQCRVDRFVEPVVRSAVELRPPVATGERTLTRDAVFPLAPASLLPLFIHRPPPAA